jgi:putative protein kinase ArgK-like GTPase of G3E family
VKTVASEGVGTEALAEAVADYEAYLKKETWSSRRTSRTGRSGWLRCCAMPCWKKRAGRLMVAASRRYAAEIAEHKRDPYSLVEGLCAASAP